MTFIRASAAADGVGPIRCLGTRRRLGGISATRPLGTIQCHRTRNQHCFSAEVRLMNDVDRLEGIWRPLWIEESGRKRLGSYTYLVITLGKPDAVGEYAWAGVALEGAWDEAAQARVAGFTRTGAYGGDFTPAPGDHFVNGGTLHADSQGHIDFYMTWMGYVHGGPQRGLY